jgi:CheY-like chemotaxis protein
LQRTHIDPSQVIAELVKMLRPLIGENIEIQTHLPPGVNTIYADSGQLQQVLLNLSLNARDAMLDGGRLIIRSENISLSAGFCAGHPNTKPGPYVLLSIADTGCGMSPAVKARIFEPFFTTKEPGKGTGLGLAMVYGMVEQHGGIVHVYSEPGAGTTFKIYLPVTASSEPRASQSISLRPAGGRETILIVEDDAMVREFLTRVLAEAGYQTLAATDGADGLRTFLENAENISLAILDVVMPHMGGRALFTRLRSINPDMRVIFCTGHDPAVNQAETTFEQDLPMLGKPVESDILLRTVRSVLDAPEKDSGDAGQRVHDGNMGEESDRVLGLSCGP